MENGAQQTAAGRWLSLAGVAALLSVVSDGWAGKPSPLLHQIGLIPFGLALVWGLFVLLERDRQVRSSSPASGRLWVAVLGIFVAWSMLMVVAEARHYRQFGYHLGAGALMRFVVVLAGWGAFWWRRNGVALLGAILVTYASGVLLAIKNFPLNYLRSDMLPVIGWADDRLLHHLNPYGTMHVGARTYDFPYLPGILLAFLPSAALHVDLRSVSLVCNVVLAVLVFWAARLGRRFEVAATIGLFLLCPFLQYRHDLYLQPHWLAVVVSVVLMQRRRFAWASFAWGVSCGIYQLSWVMFPFAVLYGFRRRGVRGAAEVVAVGIAGVLLTTGPFLRSASGRIANNTVGQWSHLHHALADPINLSYWLTYLVRPDQLKWVQAGVLTAVFAYCVVKGRCASLPDTLRWMCIALAVFIPLNVLVDGYFYLTLLLMLVLFVCAENDWWAEPGEVERVSERSVGTQMA